MVTLNSFVGPVMAEVALMEAENQPFVRVVDRRSAESVVVFKNHVKKC